MGIFRQFPYSNFHDMNMDEIIKIVKNMLEEWAQYYAEWDAWMAEINDDWSNYQEVMNEAWQNMQDFINNYFDNLNVQTEINNKITAMVNSGEFSQIVDPYVPPAVSSWLAQHITTPETVVIDDSLTIEGAAADAKATGDAIEYVQDDVNSVKDLEASIFPISWEAGGIDNATGETNNDGSPTRSRDVNYYKVSDLYDINNPNNYPLYIIFYDFDGVNYNFTHSIPATGDDKHYYFTIDPQHPAQYVRFDIRVGLSYAATVTLKAYSKIVTQVKTNAADITSLYTELGNITEMSSNKFNSDGVTLNKFIPADGSINNSENYSVTDFMPVNVGDDIYFWGKSNNTYTGINFRFVCAYDSFKNPVSAAGRNAESTPPYTVPAGIAYIRVTFSTSILTYTNIYIGTHRIGIDYEDYGIQVKLPSAPANEIHYVRSGGSILEGVIYCYANDIKNLIVESGTYDIIDEYEDYYGSDYFDDYVNYATGNLFDAGIWLQNINVKFSPGAKVVCKYTGENTNVPTYFSAFACGNNVTIDGLVLDAENLRYGIHPDFNTGSDETYFIVKNCDLKHVKASGNQAIGAGLGKHVFWQFENTIFRTVGNYYAMRIHNNVDSAAQSKIIVKDCYIDGDGYFLFNAYSTSILQTIIQLCGCSYKTAPVVGRETSGSNDNFTLIAWNNELRS